jgi:hypothetical protein
MPTTHTVVFLSTMHARNHALFVCITHALASCQVQQVWLDAMLSLPTACMMPVCVAAATHAASCPQCCPEGSLYMLCVLLTSWLLYLMLLPFAARTYACSLRAKLAD